MKMGFVVYELGFRPKLAWELGFEAWELGFGPKLGWELGFRTPLQDPLMSLGDWICPKKKYYCRHPNHLNYTHFHGYIQRRPQGDLDVN